MADQYAVIGHPVAHSKSPLIHAAFAEQTGQAITYGALLAPLDDFAGAVKRFRDAGGRGANVTLPFKHEAHTLATTCSERALQARAVNTLTFSGDDIAGDNTDGVGLIRDVTINVGCAIEGRRILLMGAGGAAYGVIAPLLDAQPASLTVVNRTIAKAHALREHFARVHRLGSSIEVVSYGALAALTFDLVINSTSAGLHGGMAPLPDTLFAAGALAYDMVYGVTPFIEFARARGARSVDGIGMLVEQAAESFYIWRGVRPETAPVIAMLGT